MAKHKKKHCSKRTGLKQGKEMVCQIQVPVNDDNTPTWIPCGKAYCTKRSLLDHQVFRHNLEHPKALDCDFKVEGFADHCGFRTTKARQMAIHKRTHNSTMSFPYVCEHQVCTLLIHPCLLPLVLDRRSIDLSGAQEKEGHFHYKNF